MTARACFALVLPAPKAWFAALSTAFTHSWVSSYQVGFGPPLIRAHDRLIASLRHARGALGKLEAYLNHCYLDDGQRRRLADLHRRLLVRRLGPVEAESIRDASRHVLDLTVQLHSPDGAPPSVREAMQALGPLTCVGLDDPPEHRAGRFWIHLGDARNTRLLDVDAVRAHIEDPDVQAVLALTVPAEAIVLFEGWLRTWAPEAGYPVVKLDGPVSVARTTRDGVAH